MHVNGARALSGRSRLTRARAVAGDDAVPRPEQASDPEPTQQPGRRSCGRGPTARPTRSRSARRTRRRRRAPARRRRPTSASPVRRRSGPRRTPPSSRPATAMRPDGCGRTARPRASTPSARCPPAWRRARSGPPASRSRARSAGRPDRRSPAEPRGLGEHPVVATPDELGQAVVAGVSGEAGESFQRADPGVEVTAAVHPGGVEAAVRKEDATLLDYQPGEPLAQLQRVGVAGRLVVAQAAA